MTGSVFVEEITALSEEVYLAVSRLLLQLSPSAGPLTRAQFQDIVESPDIHLLVARAEDRPDVAGMLTLAVFRIPTGIRAWIEDVVVDEAWRGRGIGRLLAGQALKLAETAGARTVDLTSRASRAAANRLYRSLGFEIRETNIYRYTLPNPSLQVIW
ncbi:MAG: GNAT family N-acetyltransferase [Candidatus Adiutrix sp.]|jgi:ribosomal protein S18 acetylase RimI-like enzyme|nr:GNAT family N-acetyltransferase [Candidatus Adiutrix sp.]